jgi:DNA-binding transcriptional LysR family regulator
MADLNALLIFAKVMQAGSFSAAARRLDMPVSTVSRRISELENELGAQLIERSTRHLRLTGLGAAVLDHAERILDISDALHGHVSDQVSRISGTLRLSAPPNLSDSLLAPLIDGFQAEHPAVRVQVLITERDIDHVADGIDLDFHVGPIRDTSLVARRLLRFRHRLVASPDYLASHPLLRHPSGLLDHRVLAFSHGQGEIRWTFTHVDDGMEVKVALFPHLGINDYSGVVASLLTGGGIGDLPPIVRPDLLRDGRLVEVLPDWHLPVWDLCIVHPNARRVLRPVRLFKELACRVVPTLFADLPT